MHHYYLTAADEREERIAGIVDDANERLANINEARDVAMDAIRAALAAYLKVVEDNAIRGKADWQGLQRLDVVDDLIDDLGYGVTSDLRDRAEGVDVEADERQDALERSWERE